MVMVPLNGIVYRAPFPCPTVPCYVARKARVRVLAHIIRGLVYKCPVAPYLEPVPALEVHLIIGAVFKAFVAFVIAALICPNLRGVCQPPDFYPYPAYAIPSIGC